MSRPLTIPLKQKAGFRVNRMWITTGFNMEIRWISLSHAEILFAGESRYGLVDAHIPLQENTGRGQ